MPNLLEILSRRWKQYKYRFVPWIALNLKKRTMRTVETSSNDKIIPDGKVEQSLLVLFTSLHGHSGGPTEQKQSDLKGQGLRGQGKMHVESRRSNVDYSGQLLCFGKETFVEYHTRTGRSVCEKHKVSQIVHKDSCQMCKYSNFDPELKVHNHTSDKRSWFCTRPTSNIADFYKGIKCKNRTSNSALPDSAFVMHFSKDSETNAIQRCKVSKPNSASDVMHRTMGFTIERRPSGIIDGGTGVFVTRGTVPADAVVVMYPGTVYAPWDPILLQSIANPFIFRCLDGTLIDGNDRGISRMVYRSCSQRDRIGPYLTSDLSWLTDNPANPMAVGQYVNNQNKENEANVAYQEFDVPDESFSLHLLQYIPNVFYSSTYQENDSSNTRRMRTVVLVSLREIQCGEELFSSYFTIVH